MQLLLKLENLTSHVAASNETSLFAELEMLSHSLSVDSFSNQPTRPVTIGTQVPTTAPLLLITGSLYIWVTPKVNTIV